MSETIKAKDDTRGEAQRFSVANRCVRSMVVHSAKSARRCQAHADVSKANVHTPLPRVQGRQFVGRLVRKTPSPVRNTNNRRFATVRKTITSVHSCGDVFLLSFAA